MSSLCLTIYGQPARKSNSRRIVTIGRSRKPLLIKSEDALAYVKAFGLQVPPLSRAGMGSKEKPLKVEGRLFYKTKFRGDLSGELVLDCLVGAGVISDDRYVVIQHWEKYHDSEVPRAELAIEEVSGWRWDGEKD